MNLWKFGKIERSLVLVPISIALAVLSTACGGQAYDGANPNSGSGNTTAGNTSVPWITYPNAVSSGTPTGASEPISKTFTLQGTSGAGFAPSSWKPNFQSYVAYSGISADSRLVVDVQPTSGSWFVQAQSVTSSAYEGATIYSGCMQVMVQIYDDGLVAQYGGYNSNSQIGANQYLSFNTLSSDGTGSCGLTIQANTSNDFSNAVLSSGSASTKTVMISQAYSYITSNSAGAVSNGDLALLYYTYIQSGNVLIHTDTTQ